MKKFSFILVGVIAILLASCTQNNGHIGPIFGSWSLKEITCDGAPVSINPEETFFSFQNEIVKVTHVTEYPYGEGVRFGNFSISGDVLEMRFQKDPTPGGSWQYLPPEWIPFPPGGTPAVFDIRQLKGNRLVLSTDIDGAAYVYTLTKTW